ncbi:MAG: hypothetical protein AAB552_01905 [Patescibacteria group bacterium]
MKIGLDFDGVIADCGELKYRIAKKIYGIDILPEKFKKEIVVGEGYLTTEQYRALQNIIYGTREVGFLMKPVLDALEYISRLIADGHSVCVITSREKTFLKIAKEWSLGQGLRLDFVGVGPKNSKASAARGLDLYVDDDLDKLEPLVDIVRHRFLFSWGYNIHIDAGNTAKRTQSWKELYHTIQTL